MNRTATLLVALLVVVASAAVAPIAAAQTDTPTSTATSPTQTENETATGSDNGSVAAGAMLSGTIGVQEAEIEGEVESRTFGIKIAKANTDDAKAEVVAEQLDASEERLTELQKRLDSLEEARQNGSISEDQYAARAAKVQTETNNIQRIGNETATVSETIPLETLEANGVNVTAIETLRQNAANMTGPEVAAVAKAIAGPNAGQAPDRAGGPDDRGDDETAADDRPDDDGTAPDDGVDGNETDSTTDDGTDAYSGGDDAGQGGEQGQ